MRSQLDCSAALLGLAAVFYLFAPPLRAQIAVEVQVSDSSGRPVKSRIRKYTDGDKLGEVLGITAANGKGHIQCTAVDLVLADPVPTVFRYSDPQNCSSPLNFQVQETQETINLLKAAQAYQGTGKHAAAALLFNELSQKYTFAPEDYERFAKLTYENAGKALEVEDATGSWSGHLVMTPELREALRETQGKYNFKKPDGKLDYKTLEILVNAEAGKNPSKVVGVNELVMGAPTEIK